MATRTKLMQEPPLHPAWLVIASGPRRGRIHQLEKVTNIGRDQQMNHVLLDDDAASAEHARIKYENGTHILYDLASSNGTMLNGERIQRAMLRDEDRITIGHISMVFKETKLD